jgi:hypothetical protein
MVNVFKAKQKGDGSDEFMKAANLAQTAYGLSNMFGAAPSPSIQDGSSSVSDASSLLKKSMFGNYEEMANSLSSSPLRRRAYGLGMKF